MILADKIMDCRKKNGWSQEELANRLGVSRQSVSKWESAQAVPDMKKLLQMSELFGVSTDYLIKDDIDSPLPAGVVPVDDGLEEAMRKVSMEEASAFLRDNETAAGRISTGVMMCILSPIAAVMLGGLAETEHAPFDTQVAGMVGVAILLVMVAVAVALFIGEAMRLKKYEYLESVSIDTEYGVSGMAKERRDTYAEKHTRLLIIGIMLCILCAIPVFVFGAMHFSNDTDAFPVVGVAALLAVCAVGVKLIVLTCCRQGGFDKLLEEGDYSRLNKKAGKYDGIYWAIATAIYLGWSFATGEWHFTWIVWPVAGVLFVAYREIMKAIVRAR